MNTKDMMKEITDNFERSGNVKVCFGEPIEKDNLTIITVAKLHSIGGAGSGSAHLLGVKPKESKEDSTEEQLDGNEKVETTSKKESEANKATGSGIWIDIQTTPLGYIQICDGEAEFKAIKDSDKIALAMMILSGLTIFLISHTISKLIKFKSKKTLSMGKVF
ncbi:MAG: hypothetical protein KAH01_08170 [Caldisericia bacterium]|nr:hypothetical protein [Caldisericia bacterium]